MASTLSPQLTALFNDFVAGNCGMADFDLYTITLFGGGVLRFTTADFDISAVSPSAIVNGFTYSSGGIRVDQKESKTQAHWKVGLDVDQWIVVLMPRPVDLVTGSAYPDTIGSVPWLQAAQGGALDAADFQVDRAYFRIPLGGSGFSSGFSSGFGGPASPLAWPIPPGGAQSTGCKTIFAGVVAEVDTTNAIAALVVNDYRMLLSYSMPRHYYEAQCRHTLYDLGCNASGNVSRAAYAIAGTCAVSSTQSLIYGVGLPTPRGSGTYALGQIQMTSGQNATFWRTIKSWDGSGGLTLLNPLPFAVAAGDTFQVYPGCDKLLTTCAKFNNTANFGGQPFIPPPEVTA